MKFKAVVELGGKTATGIEVPAAIVEKLGAGKKPLVTVTINGHSYPSAIAVRSGKFLIPLSAENRTKAGVAAGDRIDVNVELDTKPRTVDVPADFERALAKHPAAKRAFDAMSNSHKKRHVLAIEGAKTDETRTRRIAKAIEQLQAD
jgi:Bacteriocin-protection, YdeI or OmpD-Associated/Domain of unknown function (DUF1905)